MRPGDDRLRSMKHLSLAQAEDGGPTIRQASVADLPWALRRCCVHTSGRYVGTGRRSLRWTPSSTVRRCVGMRASTWEAAAACRMPAALLAVRQDARTFVREEKVAHADAGHIGVKKRPEIIAKHGGVEWPVAARRGTIKAMAPNGVKDRRWATRDSRPGAGGSSLLDAGES